MTVAHIFFYAGKTFSGLVLLHGFAEITRVAFKKDPSQASLFAPSNLHYVNTSIIFAKTALTKSSFPG